MYIHDKRVSPVIEVYASECVWQPLSRYNSPSTQICGLRVPKLSLVDWFQIVTERNRYFVNCAPLPLQMVHVFMRKTLLYHFEIFNSAQFIIIMQCSLYYCHAVRKCILLHVLILMLNVQFSAFLSCRCHSHIFHW